jgi:hypothetical protein
MGTVTVARWREWAGQGLEHLALAERADGYTAESVLSSTEGGVPFTARYRILLDRDWNTRRVEVARVGEDRGLVIESDGRGNWTAGASGPIPALEGGRDVDISATPFTNTIPVRRLGLAAGESRDLLVAYVRLPGLFLGAARQRYTRLDAGRRYRFEDLATGFLAEFEVDGRGLVLDYPGLFRRVI